MLEAQSYAFVLVDCSSKSTPIASSYGPGISIHLPVPHFCSEFSQVHMVNNLSGILPEHEITGYRGFERKLFIFSTSFRTAYAALHF